MAVHYGQAKSLDDITDEDALRHPIWVWALEGEEHRGHDETWQKPVTSTSDVTDELIEIHRTVIITLKSTEPRRILFSGEYDGQVISALAAWHDATWRLLPEVELAYPVVVEALPTLNGVSGARFTIRTKDEDAAPPVS